MAWRMQCEGRDGDMVVMRHVVTGNVAWGRWGPGSPVAVAGGEWHRAAGREPSFRMQELLGSLFWE